MLERLTRPALIVVDMQNDFVRAGAPLEVPAARGTVPAIAGLIDAFRAAAHVVVFTRYVADPAYRHLAERLEWLARLEPPVCACVPGTMRSFADRNEPLEGVAIIDELPPSPDDAVIDKSYYSAFHGTGLDGLLKARGVDCVVIAGTVTEMCVEDTARHAVHFGYPTVLVGDAVSSNDTEIHRNTLTAFERNYGWVMNARPLIDSFLPASTRDTP